MKIPLNEAMVLWTYETREVRVVKHPARAKDQEMSDGACYSDWRKQSKEGQLAWLYRIAMKLALFYNIPIEHINEEFQKVPEFKKHLKDGFLVMGLELC